MTENRNFISRFFVPMQLPKTAGEIWLWWEKRRLIYNIIVILTAALSLIAFFFFCVTSGKLAPGEDAEEPLGIILGAIIGPFLWNVAFCLGPVCDIILLRLRPTRHYGPLLLKLGLAFSITVLCIPSTFWFVIWIGQALKGFPQSY